MKKMLAVLFKNEKGAVELTSQVFILLGVATIIAALVVIFRTQLTNIVTDMFSNFAGTSGSQW